jgi:hypothetical protein
LRTSEGTRFRLFAQPPFVAGYERPETVWLKNTPGSIASGPADERMYVVDALDKPWPYAFPYMPPFTGVMGPATAPSPDGHFDHLALGSRAFAAAHLFASASLVLQAWESYCGHHIPWHFHQPQLELIPLLDWDNAQAGYGFVETGLGATPEGTLWPFALSFDVVAHEVGHLLLYSLVGLPEASSATPAFGAFHEAAADIVALVSLLRFESVLKRIIAHSAGNLYAENELNRFGELSASSEIRLVSNSLKLEEVDEESDIHTLSLVLSGSFFDVLCEAFLLRLRYLDLIDDSIVEQSQAIDEHTGQNQHVTEALEKASRTHTGPFCAALAHSRDFLGKRLALTSSWLEPADLTYSKVAGTFLVADELLTGDRRNWKWLVTNFAWRGIEPRIPSEVSAGRWIQPYRQLSSYPEPYEFQHSCALRGRRLRD